MGKFLDYVKRTWEENQEGYARMESEKQAKNSQSVPVQSFNKTENSSKPQKPVNARWPFDNNIDIKKLTRQQQREREEKIKLYMEAYPFLPFKIKDSKLYKPNSSWSIINETEKPIIFSALKELNSLIAKCYSSETALLEFLPNGLSIPYNKVLFGYPVPLTADSLPRSFMEYRPLTNGGNPSTTPLIAHYTTFPGTGGYAHNECHGELLYGLDGSVCSAKAHIFKDNKCYSFSFGIIGRTFAITRIEVPNYANGKKIVAYESKWDYIEY